MGQSGSTAQSRRKASLSRRSKSKSTALISTLHADEIKEISGAETSDESRDYVSDLPDECLACIFQYLNSRERKRCSLVCRRWLRIEGQSRHRLSLKAQSDLLKMIPALFSRFDAVTKLALKCDRRYPSIEDDALVMISHRCRNLTRLKLRSCRDITDVGIRAFAVNCKELKKLSCGSCAFGAKGMNAVLQNCSNLEEISIKRLRGITEAEHIDPGAVAASLRTICLKELYNGQCFRPLLLGAKNLRSLKILRCSGDWDILLQGVSHNATGIVEIHLERIQVSDLSLSAISNCSNLEILHLVKTPECTNVGLAGVAEHCKLLRKLHIDGWKMNRIGDEGLIAVAKSCPKLQELVLIGVNPTNPSLEKLASNCQNLERLALCSSDTFGDPELCCIAEKCRALRKLCIKNCPITDQGMQALASGCPDLVKVKIKKCSGVTYECADWLKASRDSLAVKLDTPIVENQEASASASDSGVQENGIEFIYPALIQTAEPRIGSSSRGQSASFRLRFGHFGRRSLVACTLRRWSSLTGNSEEN